MRLAPRLAALLLCATALCGCGTASMIAAVTGADDPAKPAAPPKPAPTPATVANDIDGNVRHAQLLRIAGNYDEAIKILSQLMLVAPDDPRITAEYGKNYLQKGRASDANQFLSRAIELSPNDWTLYSALGVSFDQIGDQVNARAAYEHALALKPNDASVLNNYAMNRMLAKDPQTAKLLIARAQAAGGGADTDKIARNLAMINDMAPDGTKAEAPVAVAAGPKSASAQKIASAPKPAPRNSTSKIAENKPAPAKADAPKPSPAIVAEAPKPAPDSTPHTSSDVASLLASQPAAIVPQVADAAPRALTGPQSGPPIPVVETAAIAPPELEAQPIAQAPIVPSGVVMQAVPYDPLAGPVVRLRKPAPKAVAKADAPKTSASKTDAPKNAAARTEPPKRDAKSAPAKTAASPAKVPALRMAADKY